MIQKQSCFKIKHYSILYNSIALLCEYKTSGKGTAPTWLHMPMQYIWIFPLISSAIQLF